MNQTLIIVTPVFAIMACGWLFAHRQLISDAGINGIVNFIFYLAIPAVIFRTLASGSVQQQFSPSLLLAYYGAAIPHFLFCWWVSRRLFRQAVDTSSLAAMAGTFSNLVLIGLPLIQRAYGPAGLVPVMLIVMVHSPILFTLTTLGVTLGRSNGAAGGIGRIVWNSLRSVISNPIAAAALGGLVYGSLGLPFPSLLNDTLALLGEAAAPTSLFAVGATLAACKLGGDLIEAVVMAVLKVTVLPMLVWLLTRYVIDVPSGWSTILILSAAMPTGANAYVMARKYNCYTQRATAIVVLSTVISVFTLTALIALLPPL